MGGREGRGRGQGALRVFVADNRASLSLSEFLRLRNARHTRGRPHSRTGRWGGCTEGCLRVRIQGARLERTQSKRVVGRRWKRDQTRRGGQQAGRETAPTRSESTQERVPAGLDPPQRHIHISYGVRALLWCGENGHMSAADHHLEPQRRQTCVHSLLTHRALHRQPLFHSSPLLPTRNLSRSRGF